MDVVSNREREVNDNYRPGVEKKNTWNKLLNNFSSTYYQGNIQMDLSRIKLCQATTFSNVAQSNCAGSK